MNDRLRPGVREASRLTRAGRLMDATALLQRALRSGRDRNSFASNVPPTIDLVPEAVEVTRAERSRPERTVRAHLPEGLRGFLDRITTTRFVPGPDGLAEPSAPDASVPEGGQFLSKSNRSQAGS